MICQYKNCNNHAYYYGYCYDHVTKCDATKCDNITIRGFNYCKIHLCKGCDKYSDDGLCDICCNEGVLYKRCDESQCYNESDDNYCDNHVCRYRGCNNKGEFLNYCKNHLDEYSIINMKECIYNYNYILHNSDTEDNTKNEIYSKIIKVSHFNDYDKVDRDIIVLNIPQSHICFKEDCEKWRLIDSKYCLIHRCPICKEYKDSNEDACTKDMCVVKDCKKCKYNYNSDFCINHVCFLCYNASGKSNCHGTCSMCNSCDCDIGKLGITEKITRTLVNYIDRFSITIIRYDSCLACACKRCKYNKGNIYTKDFSVTAENITIDNIKNDLVRLCDICATIYPLKKIYEIYPDTGAYVPYIYKPYIDTDFEQCKRCGYNDNIVGGYCENCKYCKCSFGEQDIMFESNCRGINKSQDYYCMWEKIVNYGSCIACKCILCGKKGEVCVPYYAKNINHDEMYILLDNACSLCKNHKEDIFINIDEVDITFL